MLRQLLDRVRAKTAIIAATMAERRSNRTGTYLLRSDGRWRGRIQLGLKENGDPDVRTVYAKTREEAERKINALVREYEQGQLTSIDGGRLTLATFVTEHWLPAVKSLLKPTTYRSYEQISRVHILPRLGQVRLARLTPRMIQMALGEVSDEGLSPQTVKTVQRVLHRALVFAVRWRYLTTNPATYVETPPIPKKRHNTLSSSQMRRFLSVKDDRLALICKLAFVTGMRQGDLLGLQWRDFDPDGRRLLVRRSYNAKFGYQTPKNHKDRDVPIPDELVADLVTLRMLTKHDASDDPIFATLTGRPILGPNVTRWFKRRLKEAGIEGHYRFHDLRHTHATLMLGRSDVSTAAVADVLGPLYSPAVTHGLYDQGSVGFGGDYRAAQEGLLHG